MNPILNNWIMQTVAMILTVILIPKLRVTNIFGPALAVIALALINATLWDAALFLKIPNSISIQTALLIVTNGLIFWLIVKLLPGIEIEGILPALLAPLAFSLVSLILVQYQDSLNYQALWQNLARIFQNLKEYFDQSSA